MDSHQEPQLNENATELDVYERANAALQELIVELCDALEVEAEPFKQKGYELVAHAYRQPVHTGELTLMFAAVLQDILQKLEMTQQGEQVTMIYDKYTIMKRDDV